MNAPKKDPGSQEAGGRAGRLSLVGVSDHPTQRVPDAQEDRAKVRLSYNCWHPQEILKSLVIRTSVVNGRDRGVSLSANPEEYGHGAFRLVFKPGTAWYSQFEPCKYGTGRPIDFLHKPACFEIEQEWWSPLPVIFQLGDLESLQFLSNGPGKRLHPIKSTRTWRQLAEKWGGKIRLEVDATSYPRR